MIYPKQNSNNHANYGRIETTIIITSFVCFSSLTTGAITNRTYFTPHNGGLTWHHRSAVSKYALLSLFTGGLT